MNRLVLSTLSFCAAVWIAALQISQAASGEPQKEEAPLTQSALVAFRVSPAAPEVGQRVSLFFTLGSGFSRQELVADVFIGTVPLSLQKVGDKLFAASLNRFSQVGSHTLRADLYLRDFKKAERAKAALAQVEKEIQELNEEIAAEPDPARKAELERIRDGKAAYQTELEDSLEAMKTFLKSESFSFQVSAPQGGEEFPVITAVTPDAVITGERTRVKILGERFPSNPNVKIGGLNATLIQAAETEIEVLAPLFQAAETGLKEVDVRFPQEGSRPEMNAVLSNGFFVTNQAVLKNLPPVAITPNYVSASWPHPGAVTLNGSGSFDPNGHTLNFRWEVLAAPNAASTPPGTLLAAVPNPTITPNKKGIYLIQLIVRENNTPEEYASVPATITLEVK